MWAAIEGFLSRHVWLVVAAGVAALVALACVLDSSHRRKVLGRLRRRFPRPLTDAEFAALYAPDDPEAQQVAVRVRELLREHQTIDSSSAPPDCDLPSVLPDELDSMGLVSFVLSLEKAFDIKIPDERAQDLLTLRDVIDFVVAEVRRGCASGGG